MKNKKFADIIDVANAAGVSPATVSRTFNHPDVVRPGTRKRIQQAVEATGYIRNRAAQAIHGIRSGTIGLIVPTLDNAIFANLIQAFTDRLAENGLTMLVATHGYDLDLEYNLLRSVLEHRVEGVGLIGLDHREESYALIERRRTPAVCMWNFAEQSRIPCIGSDNYQAGCMIARHVLDLGHKHIAMMFPDISGNDRAAERFRGVIETLRAGGVSVPEDMKIETKYSVRHARGAGMSILGRVNRPTAIIAGNDVIAQGLVYAAHSLGLAIPGQVSIAGIGDFSGSADIYPALTTVRLRSNMIGTLSADQLIAQIKGGTNPSGENISVELKLQIRESTANPPSDILPPSGIFPATDVP